MLLTIHDKAASKMIILSLIAGLDPTDKTAAIQAMIDPIRPA